MKFSMSSAEGSWTAPRLVFMALFLVAFSFVFLSLAHSLLDQVNLDSERHDQAHNMVMAEKARDHFYPYYTWGVVNPLWPWVAGKFYIEESEAFFLRGKWINLTIALGFCWILGLGAMRKFSLLATVNLVLLAGLVALLPRAIYFQPETLYYIAFFASWIVAMRLLRYNPVWLYGLFGLVTGLAYLAKASITPLLLVFVGVTTYRFLGAFFPALVGRKETEKHWSGQRHFIGMAFLLVGFLLVTFPRANFSMERFGSPFHTYTSYWFWMDNFEQCYAFMEKFPDKESLRMMTDDERPSLRNYLQDHTPTDMFYRLVDGTWSKTKQFFWPRTNRQEPPWRELLPARGIYLAVLAVIALTLSVVIATRRKKWGLGEPTWHSESGRMALFVLGTFCAYALLYGWYALIDQQSRFQTSTQGDRFLMSLYLPLAWTLWRAGEYLHRRCGATPAARVVGGIYYAAHGMLFLAISWRIFELWRNPVFGEG